MNWTSKVQSNVNIHYFWIDLKWLCLIIFTPKQSLIWWKSAKILKLPFEPPHQDDSMILLNLFMSFKSASLYHTSGLIWKLSCVIGKLKKSLVCLEHLPSFLLLRWKLCIQILAHPPCPLLRIEMNQDNPSSAVWKPTQNSHMGLWGII